MSGGNIFAQVDELALYRRAKRRMVNVVRSISDDELAAVCPACPAWSIRDLVAHHVHVVGAYTDETAPPEARGGFLEIDDATREAAGVVRDEWTEAGVIGRRGLPLERILDEWAGVVRRMKPDDEASLFDLIVHLGDVVEALGDRRGVDTELAERAIYTCYEFALTRRLARLGDTVTLQCCDTGTRIGTFPRAAEVRGTANELLRTLAGRRTRAEADEALDWGDASLDARHLFPVYGWPT